MTTDSPLEIIHRYPEHDQQWAKGFLLGMTGTELSPEQARSELEAALEMINGSGQRASQLFDDPWEFSQTRAQALHTPEQRANAEYPVQNSASLVVGVFAVIGLLCLGFGIWIGFRDGWTSKSWHYTQLASLIAGAGVGLSLHLWWFYRFRGQFRRAWVTGILGSMVSIGVAGLVGLVGGEQSMPIWNWVAPLLGIAAVVAAFCLPTPQEDSHEATSQSDSPDSWFAETGKQLRGRYGMSRQEAKEALAPVPQHWIDSRIDGRELSMSEEFGTPNEFVISLGPSTSKPAKRRWLLLRLLPLAVAIIYGFYVVPDLFRPDRSGWDILMGIALVVFIGITVFELRPRNRLAYVARKISERQAQARALEDGRDE